MHCHQVFDPTCRNCEREMVKRSARYADRRTRDIARMMRQAPAR